MDHYSTLTVKFTVIPKIIVTKIYIKCGNDHYIEDYTKERNIPEKCALCTKDSISNNKEFPVFKADSKRRNNHHLNNQS